MVGHRTAIVTKTVHRHQLMPEIETDATRDEHDLEPPEENRVYLTSGSFWLLYVPKTLSTSCHQAVLVDQASGVGLPSDAVPVEIDRFG